MIVLRELKNESSSFSKNFILLPKHYLKKEWLL